ncbi:hypothetical protein BD779DRAFT_1609431 [Infundibulicybe gibba]|nr:hypothetical protein BD779DRAFT_1609431 [Infundibulicybe gibba]
MDEAREWDKHVIGNWNDNMDVMLIFAGLFSAILTAFIIEFYKLLQPDPEDGIQNLLGHINQTLLALASGQVVTASNFSAPMVGFQPPALVLWTNGLWFISLSCSLGAAMTAMLVKQWFQTYSSDLNTGDPHMRFNSITSWYIAGIVSALPLFMHMSVVLFLAGLLIQLWQINHTIAIAVTTVIGIFLTFYMVTLVIPMIFKSCPYKSSAMLVSGGSSI